MSEFHRVPTGAARSVVRAGLLALVALSLVAGTALAGKPSGGVATGGAVRVLDGSFGGTTTAYAGPSSATTVRARCYQAGTLVYEQYRPFDASRTAILMLGPTPAWASGAANCTAEDGYWRRGTTWRVTSRSTFSVSG
jgi:hypothetical protein